MKALFCIEYARKQDINTLYNIVKADLEHGEYDLYECIPAIFYALKNEDYEYAEAIRLAVADYGLAFEIPKTETELKKLMTEYYENDTFEQ